MEAFITRSNADRIIKQMDLTKLDIQAFSEQIKFKWFNKGELRKLKAYEMLFSNPNLFLSHFVALKPREDKSDYVFNSNSAYHIRENCSKMHSDFTNIKIPSEIIRLGRRQEYIQFCNDNIELYKNYPDQFSIRLKWRFKITCDPFVHFENSGYQKFENMSFSEINEAIENKISEFNNWIEESDLNRQVIENFGLQSFNYKKPEMINPMKLACKVKRDDIIEILKHFELNIKHPLIKLMTFHYRLKNNSNLSFNSNILSELGFRACSNCGSKSQIDFGKNKINLRAIYAGRLSI
jgi:hypothetical protein